MQPNNPVIKHSLWLPYPQVLYDERQKGKCLALQSCEKVSIY